MTDLEQLALAMIDFYEDDADDVQHSLKVWSFCRLIGSAEGVDEQTMRILEAAALLHDIGIKPALAQYGYQNGKLQEELGPPEARLILKKLQFESELVERVCFLISKHHTYTGVDGLDYRILLEADYLVNLFEFQQKGRDIYAASDRILQTETGIQLFRSMFPSN